ncbi:hypothetical protein JCM10207_007062 [Rhodosporidiobolus poonsookiae]
MAPLIDLATSTTEQQWYWTWAELARSPSVRDGMRVGDEWKQRQKAVKWLWSFKDASGLKQTTITTAATFLHRFYMRETFQTYEPLLTSAAAVFLACKSEEDPKSIKTVVQAVLDIKRKGYASAREPHQINSRTEDFAKVRTQLTVVEEALLHALCFDLTVRDPHVLAIETAERMWKEPEKAEAVARAAWAFLNDSLALPLCIIHRPHLLAAASLVLGCAETSTPLPDPPLSVGEQRTLYEAEAEEGEEASFEPEVYWTEVLDVRPHEVEAATKDMLRGYKLAVDDFLIERGEKLSEWIKPLLASLPRPAAPPAPPAPAQPIAPAAASIAAPLVGLDHAAPLAPKADAGQEDVAMESGTAA